MPMCAVHALGDGAGWSSTTVEALDVDQPHGLDYRQLNHIAIGVRKRAEHEHSDFADATVGMNHLPGGCRVLGIVDSTSDLTKGAGDASIDITENKFIGRGLVYDQTKNVLWCWTNSDGTTTGNPYRLKFHPDNAWEGGDITWTGGHEFDASVDISGNVALDGDLTVDGTCHFDATGIEFGGSAGIGLFYDPTAYTAGETCTLGNGLIIKMGTKVCGAIDVGGDVSFAAAFPNNIVAVAVTPVITGLVGVESGVKNVATTGMTVYTEVVNGTVHWIAIGR